MYMHVCIVYTHLYIYPDDSLVKIFLPRSRNSQDQEMFLRPSVFLFFNISFARHKSQVKKLK